MSDHIRIQGCVTHTAKSGPVENAMVRLFADAAADAPIAERQTDAQGRFDFDVSSKHGKHTVWCEAFGKTQEFTLTVEAGRLEYEAPLDLPLDLRLSFLHYSENDGRLIPAPYTTVGRQVVVRIESGIDRRIADYQWHELAAGRITGIGREVVIVVTEPRRAIVGATIIEGRQAGAGAKARVSGELGVFEPDTRTVGGHIRVTMERTDSARTVDENLWSAIRERSEAIGFERYHAHIRRVFELGERVALPGEFSRRLGELGARGVGAYRTLRDLTELFVLSECGPIADRERFDDAPVLGDFRPERQRSRDEIEDGLRQYLHHGELPYIERVVKSAYPRLDLDAPGLDALRRRMFRQPLFLELWHEMCLEHGMLMRTMDAVCARFQNILNRGENDALAGYELSPLWPLGDFFWDWINHEPTRLNPRRRIQEYQHQYGPTLLDRNVAGIRPADVRMAFPDAFINLLNLCEVFYKEDNQTTVIADAFPVLVALREVHQILAMGAGNAAPQLTFAARVETLMMQLMLAQPELRAFLRTREMVPYDEAWMGQVDAMKDLQGWQQPSITHYRDLAVFGERIVLSIRLADWTAGDETNARNWLRHHKNAIRRYTHAHRAVSSVEPVAGSEWPAQRPALAGDGRRPMLSARQPARPELRYAENPEHIGSRLPSRGRPID